MPLLVLILIALAGGLLAACATGVLERRQASARMTAQARTAVKRRPGLRASLGARLDPATATGLLLALALAALAVGGAVVGALAFFVRSQTSVDRLDASINRWAHDHATTFSTDGLQAITQLGATSGAIALAVAVAVAESLRTRNRWVVPFMAAVVAGEFLLHRGIKELVDRARPTLNPDAAGLGPSFPSGHTTTAAAAWAAAALIISRWHGAPSPRVLVGGAVAIALGVAASRVLLGVHWVTDTLAGLALGWGWFALCAIAFGGRLLRFGAAAEAITEPARPSPSAQPRGGRRRETAHRAPVK